MTVFNFLWVNNYIIAHKKDKVLSCYFNFTW